MCIMSVCVNCGKSFESKTSKAKYCSSRCKEAHRIARIPEIDGVCIGCGAPIKYKLISGKPSRRFCSSSCQARNTVPKKVCVCIDCGVSFEFIGRTVKKRCDDCNKKHRSRLAMEYRARKDPTVMIGVGSGGWQNPNPAACTSSAAERIRELRRELYKLKGEAQDRYAKYKLRKIVDEHSACDICGYNKYTESLVVHHKDMNRDNNQEYNLTIVCRNCHEHIHKECRKSVLKLHNKTPLQVYEDIREAEVKSRNKAGTPTGQPEPKAISNGSQGQSVVAGPDKDISHQEAVTRE